MILKKRSSLASHLKFHVSCGLFSMCSVLACLALNSILMEGQRYESLLLRNWVTCDSSHKLKLFVLLEDYFKCFFFMFYFKTIIFNNNNSTLSSVYKLDLRKIWKWIGHNMYSVKLTFSSTDTSYEAYICYTMTVLMLCILVD